MSEKILNTGFLCIHCGEALRLKADLSDSEVQHALAGFLLEHIERHGGDPLRVFFESPFDVMVRCS